jgi:hypothetical protein
METKEVFGWSEISTNCSCQTENDETGDFGPSNECFGDCFENSKENLFWLIDDWRQHNPFTEDTLIRIDGSGMGWRGQNGYTDVTLDEVAEALYLNGDFTIRYELSENFVLTAQRWSHDEPMGSAIFTFTKSPLNKCEACGEIDETISHTTTYERYSGEQFTETNEYCRVCLEMRIG